VRRYAVRLAVAALVVAPVGFGVPAPAQASACSTARGVSVVVDFHQLGGGVQTFCDAGGAGKTADAQLRDAGYELTYVQRQPGFICRIDTKPADDPCVNTPPSDAYWSLWWSDGKSGEWSYSSAGASSLKVPEGGYVGMSWQGGDAKAEPGLSPTPHAPRASSSASPHRTTSPHPSTAPGQASSSSTAVAPMTSTSATPSPGQKAGDGKQQHVEPSKVGKARGQDTHGPDRTQAGEPLQQVTADAPDDTGGSGSGLPGWVAPVAIAVVFAGAATIALVRRRSSGGA
jgi:hypothetical protein